MPCIVKYLY